MDNSLTCQIPEHNQCCCVCKFHLPDQSHPLVDGGKISQRKGWICFPPEFNGLAFSGWSMHGLCEQFMRKKYALNPINLKATTFRF